MKGTLTRLRVLLRSRAVIPPLLVGATAIACQSGTQPPGGGLVCPVQSAAAPVGAAIARALAAAIPDASRNTIWSATNGVTLQTVANPGGRTLSSPLTGTAGHGIAMLGNLGNDRPGSGYALRESAAGFPRVTTARFAAMQPCTGGTPLSLAVAAYTAVDPTTNAGCTEFPANASAALVEYLLVPQSASGTPNDSESFRLQGGTVTPGPVAGQLTLPRVAPAPLSPAEQFHQFLRRSERARSYRMPPRGARAPTGQLAPQPSGPLTSADSGSARSFKVCGDLQCNTPLPVVRACLVKLGQHIAIYLDSAAPSPGLSQTDLNALRDVFDNRLYAVDHGAFGVESDIDGNGVVIVLMTNQINKLVTASQCQTTGFVAGYFFGADIDPQFASAYNNGEIFYSIVPDPAGTLSCTHTVAQVKQLVPVTFVHEFQHMISYNQHVLVRHGEAEILWLNEALSHYAEERGGRSFLPGDTTTFCSYVVGDLYNAGQYFTAPQSHFLVDTAGIGGLAERGAYWLFVHYLIDQFAQDTSLVQADAFTQTLDQTLATGVTNVQNASGGTPFATLVERWALANYVSDLPGFVTPPELKYKVWAFRTAYPRLRSRCNNGSIPAAFPLVPGVGAGGAVNLSGFLHAGSGTYYRAQQSAGAAGFTLLFSDAMGGALQPSVVPRLNVIRIQ